MLKRIKLIPSTKESHPFATAVNKYDFQKAGYTEDEFFMYGTANVYEEEGISSFKTIHQDIPYCNRFMVRRPSDPKDFSGNVIIEILNATAAVDLDRMWVISGRHLMRRGDIYIGITSKPDVFNSLFAFDAERYSEINWNKNFDREFIPQDNPFMPKMRQECETGLFWDILTDLAVSIKQDGETNPIPREYIISKVLLTGWSQSAAYLCTYVNRLAFNQNYNKGTQIFDGYFAAGGVHSFVVPLNQSGYLNSRNGKENIVSFMPVPYVAVQTESENAYMGGFECRQANSDENDLKYRIYEIPGSTHDTVMSLLDYYADDENINKTGKGPRYVGENEHPNCFPYQFAFNAAFTYFFNWVESGTEPPVFPRIDINPDLSNATDDNGNATGGMRSPFIDCPVFTFYPYSDLNGSTFGLFGHVDIFSAEKLKEMYGSAENYRKLAEASTDDCIKKGYLLTEDRAEIINTAVSFASASGLN